MKIKSWKSWLLLTLLWILAWPGVGLAQDRGGEVVYAMNREPDMLDLQVGSSRYDLVVAANVYDTYLFLNDDGEFLPWLAEEVTMSDDATEYTIRLRTGVTFQDGTPLDAEAVRYNFDRIVAPETQSRGAIGDMGSYNRTEVLDELTAKVYFDEPHPAFWFSLSDWRAGGPHSPTALEADAEGFKFAPVGTGPFRVIEWEQRDRIVLEPYADYAWPRPDTKHSGAAYLDRLVFRFIPEAQARMVSLQTGDVNGVLNVPPQDVAALKNNSGFVVVERTLPGTGVIIVVNGGKSPTNDPAIRKAILHATSQDQLSRIGYFNAWPSHRGSVLSEPNPGFIDLSGTYEFNLEEASLVLDEAGWEMGRDGVRVKDGERAELVYIGFPSAETTRVLEFMQATLQPLGISVSIRELDSGAIQKARQDGDHNIAHLTWIFKDAGFLRTLFHSENIGTGWNFTHAPDAKLDAMLEEAETTADLEARRQLYAEVQRHMLEQAMVIPTVYQHNVSAFHQSVRDVELYPVYGEAPYFYDAYVDGQ
jgi:peptide/nickel transport system substrate-binding protein